MKYRMLFIISMVPVLSTLCQDAREIVRRADEHVKGSSSFAVMTIQIIRPSWSREMDLKAWTRGNDQTLILITDPIKDRGVVYLKRKKEVWNWIPSIERNIKLPPSMMSQSWMGTDFTNDDLVKEASIVDDYEHTFLSDSVVDGRPCYKIQLLPHPRAAVVWGKVLLWIDKKDNLLLHATYFDEEGRLINTMHCSEIKVMGGRLLPSRMEMIPTEKKGNKTLLIYKSLQFDLPLNDNFFTTQNMSRIQ